MRKEVVYESSDSESSSISYKSEEEEIELANPNDVLDGLIESLENDLKIEEDIPLKVELPKQNSIPKFLKPPQMTDSQFVKLETAISGVEEIVGNRNSLTKTGYQRLKIHLVNLEEIRRTLVQMIEVYLGDEEVSENLFVLLDYINHGINLQSADGEEFSDELQEFRDALALSQIIIDKENEEAIEADAEFARKLQLEFEKEVVELQAIAEENIPIIPPAPPLNIKKKEPKIEEVDNVPVNIKNLEENSLTVNPIEHEPIQIDNDGNVLVGIFTLTNLSFLSWNASPLSSIQYIEVTIKKRYKSFKEPFVLALWKDCNPDKMEFSYELLARLSPFSGCMLENPLKCIGSVQGESIKEGDTVGIGMFPQSGGDYIIFTTQNGKWVGHFIYSDPINVGRINFHNEFRLVLLTGSAFKSPQLEVSLNDGLNPDIPFVFDLKLPMEDCSICYDDVLSACITVIDNCGHRFCKECVKGYLTSALDRGEVLDTKCPDMNCDELLTDKILQESLSLLEYGKFKQFRLLAGLRLEPNCRWCPKDGCENGVIGNFEDDTFPKLTCGECLSEFCFHCSDFWHEGMTCKQKDKFKIKQENKADSKRKKNEEKETRKWMKHNKTIKCSKCSALVQRKEGCNHMTCNCGHEFCWLCGETIFSVVGGSTCPIHYLTGACAGLQFSKKDELSTGRKVIRKTLAPVRFGVSLPVRPFQMIKTHYFN